MAGLQLHRSKFVDFVHLPSHLTRPIFDLCFLHYADGVPIGVTDMGKAADAGNGDRRPGGFGAQSLGLINSCPDIIHLNING